MFGKLSMFLLIIFSLLVSACGAAPVVQASPNDTTAASSSQEAVESFYAWYLDYITPDEKGNFNNLVSDRAYRQSEYLSSDFIDHIDEFTTLPYEQRNYDPFLCAQNIPGEIFVDTVYRTEDKTSILVGDDFVGYHRFTVDLREVNGEWKISNITCAVTPAGAATAFYTWYLVNIDDPADETFHNLLSDGSYRESGLLSEAYINKVNNLRASSDKGGYDPFLMAQDIPWAFSVDPGQEEKTAVVHLRFGTETIHHLLIRFNDEKGWLQIEDISVLESQ